MLLLTVLTSFSASPVLASRGGYGAVIDAQQAVVQRETSGTLPTYSLDAEFTPVENGGRATITGILALHFVNATGAAQSTVALRLYPNSEIYPAGGMTIDRVSIDGSAATSALSVHDTVAMIALPHLLAAGAAADLSISFTTRIPADPQGTYGMFGSDSATGVYALANWFPILAGFDPETGWLLDPPARIGDPVFTNDALFDARISAPRRFTVAAGGNEVGVAASGLISVHHIVAGPARDFVVAISDRFASASRTTGDTTVTSYFLPDAAEAGENALRFGARALQLYSERYGTYPYRTLALVEMPLGAGAGGVEFPQLVYLSADYYGGDPNDGAATLDFLVAHEVAHQWFYGLVGNDQYRHAFLDEALANVSALLDLQTYRGAAAASAVLERSVIGPYRIYLESHDDRIVDALSESFPSVQAYNVIVYGKAVVGFLAIRDAIGQRAFDAALARYVSRYRFTTATPSDLLGCFGAESSRELTGLWNYWFEEAHGLTNSTALR